MAKSHTLVVFRRQVLLPFHSPKSPWCRKKMNGESAA